MQWEGNHCLLCVPGTYKCKKTGLCTIKDPHCMIFDEEEEYCRRCRRGWEPKGSECVRKSRY